MSLEQHFLAHPEIEELLISVFTTLVAESDRGAVTIGFAHVDQHLKALFEHVAPSGLSALDRNRVLKYPGPLSTAAAKMDVAFFTRLIPRTLYDAMQNLRAIRNKVAHSPGSFDLAEHDEQLRRVYDLGPSVPAGINRFAVETMMKDFTDRMMSSDLTGEDGKPFFETPKDVFAHLQRNPRALGLLEGKRRRYELAMGVVLICALIVHHRDRARQLIADSDILSEVFARRNSTETPPVVQS